MSCQTERWGVWRKMGGGAYLLGSLHSPFAHRGGAARNPRAEGEGQDAPADVAGVRTGGGHAARRGGGMQTYSLHASSPSLHPRSRAASHAKWESADGGRRREGGRRVLAHCLRVLFLCLYLLNYVLLFTYSVAQSNTKAEFKLYAKKPGRTVRMVRFVKNFGWRGSHPQHYEHAPCRIPIRLSMYQIPKSVRTVYFHTAQF